MVKKRIEWVDMAKSLAILLMIVGHELPFGNLRTIIFSFHMPLFFILSGYTSHRVSSITDLNKVIRKLFIRIWLLAMIMLVFGGIEGMIFHNTSLQETYVSILRGTFWASNIPGRGIGNVGVVWFLFVYFWAKVIFDTVRLIIKNDNYNGVVFAILAYGGYLVSKKIWLPQALDVAMVAAFFIWCGAKLRSLDLDRDELESKLTVSSLFVWLICVQNNLSIELASRSYPNFVIVVVEAVAGSIVCILLAKGLLTNKLTSWLVVFGRYTLILLCVHHLDMYWGGWERFVHGSFMAATCRLLLDLVLLSCYLGIKTLMNKVTTK